MNPQLQDALDALKSRLAVDDAALASFITANLGALAALAKNAPKGAASKGVPESQKPVYQRLANSPEARKIEVALRRNAAAMGRHGAAADSFVRAALARWITSQLTGRPVER